MAKGKASARISTRPDKGARVGNEPSAELLGGVGNEDLGDVPKRPVTVHGRSDRADAFLPDPEDGPVRVTDDLAEILAEDFLKSATSGEDASDESMDEVVPEELGGPFIETSAAEEFARGVDDSNPEDATPEPLPRAVHGLTTVPR